jgi:hypothetical protein
LVDLDRAVINEHIVEAQYGRLNRHVEQLPTNLHKQHACKTLATDEQW